MVGWERRKDRGVGKLVGKGRSGGAVGREGPGAAGRLVGKSWSGGAVGRERLGRWSGWSGKAEAQRPVVSWLAGQMAWKGGELGFSVAFPDRLARMVISGWWRLA